MHCVTHLGCLCDEDIHAPLPDVIALLQLSLSTDACILCRTVLRIPSSTSRFVLLKPFHIQ